MSRLAYPNMPMTETGYGTPQLGYSAGIGAYSTPPSQAVYSAPLPNPVPTPTMSSMGASSAPMPSVPEGVVTPGTVAPVAPAAPTAAAGPGGVMGIIKNSLMAEGGGLNFDNLGSLAESLGSLGSLWAGFQANKVAKDALSFQKKSYNTNLANQLQSYNTALEDRMKARAGQMGLSEQETRALIERNRLKG